MKLVFTPGMTRKEYIRQKTAYILTILQDAGFSAEELRQISDSTGD